MGLRGPGSGPPTIGPRASGVRRCRQIDEDRRRSSRHGERPVDVAQCCSCCVVRTFSTTGVVSVRTIRSDTGGAPSGALATRRDQLGTRDRTACASSSLPRRRVLQTRVSVAALACNPWHSRTASECRWSVKSPTKGAGGRRPSSRRSTPRGGNRMPKGAGCGRLPVPTPGHRGRSTARTRAADVGSRCWAGGPHVDGDQSHTRAPGSG